MRLKNCPIGFRSNQCMFCMRECQTVNRMLYGKAKRPLFDDDLNASGSSNRAFTSVHRIIVSQLNRFLSTV